MPCAAHVPDDKRKYGAPQDDDTLLGGSDGGAAVIMNVTSGATEPVLIVINSPKPDHVAPFQPSPNESVRDSVHTAPFRMVALCEKGAPPLRL